MNLLFAEYKPIECNPTNKIYKFDAFEDKALYNSIKSLSEDITHFSAKSSSIFRKTVIEVKNQDSSLTLRFDYLVFNWITKKMIQRKLCKLVKFLDI